MSDNTSGNGTGFSLPTPDAASSAASSEISMDIPQATYPAVMEDTSSRDLFIGGGVLLVLLVAFFFVKNGYANTLVAKRVPPNKANASGWWLFVLLGTLSTGVVLAAVNTARFMGPFIVGPLAAVGLIALVQLVLTSRR